MYFIYLKQRYKIKFPDTVTDNFGLKPFYNNPGLHIMQYEEKSKR
jgi:hypothetical protein